MPWYQRPNIAHITERIWLGDAFDAINTPLLNELGVTSVANCTPEDFGTADKGFRTFILGCDDGEPLPHEALRLLWHWMDVQDALDARLLIHCHAGLSRSPSCLIGWFMLQEGLHKDSDLLAAWSRYEDQIRRLRPNIEPHYKVKGSILAFFEGLERGTQQPTIYQELARAMDSFYGSDAAGLAEQPEFAEAPEAQPTEPVPSV